LEEKQFQHCRIHVHAKALPNFKITPILLYIILKSAETRNHHNGHLSQTHLHARHNTTYSGAYSLANPEKKTKKEKEETRKTTHNLT
jgi:hypothetical protein